jgi:hypothetical protein
MATREDRKAPTTTTVIVNPLLEKMLAQCAQTAAEPLKNKYLVKCRKSMTSEAKWCHASALFFDPKWKAESMVFDDKASAVAWIKAHGNKEFCYYILYEGKKLYDTPRYVPEVWTTSHTDKWHIQYYHIKAQTQNKRGHQKAGIKSH